MASIRKRGSKYEVQIRRVNCKSITKSFIRLSDAKRWARMMEVKADCHDLPISQADLKQYRLKDIIERYRDKISIKKKSYNTEVYILNAFLRTDLAKLRLIQLSTSDFSLYRENRLKTVKAGTVNRELGIIQHALSVARDEWSKIPDGVSIPCTQNQKLALDLRADSGYVIYAESRNTDGQEYAITKQLPMAELPCNWIEFFQSGKAKNDATLTDGNIAEGGRNVSLTSLVGTFLNRGVTGEKLLKLAHMMNQQLCNPPLPDWEVDTIVKSIGKSRSENMRKARCCFCMALQRTNGLPQEHPASRARNVRKRSKPS